MAILRWRDIWACLSLHFLRERGISFHAQHIAVNITDTPQKHSMKKINERKNKWESQSILSWFSLPRTSRLLLFTVLHIAAGSSSLIILLFIQTLATEGAAIPWDSVSLETVGISGEEMKTVGGSCSLPRGLVWYWESVVSQHLWLICQRGAF